MLVSRTASGEVTGHIFRALPGLLLPGDLLVVNTSGTLPAQVRPAASRVHFSTPRPDGSWLVELRRREGKTSGRAAGHPRSGHHPARRGDPDPGGPRAPGCGGPGCRSAVVPYLLRHGVPIRYSYVRGTGPADYQTVFARRPGSAEMPSAAVPSPRAVVTELVARGRADRPAHPAHRGVLAGGGRGPVPGAVRRAARHGPTWSTTCGRTAAGSSRAAPRWCARWRRAARARRPGDAPRRAGRRTWSRRRPGYGRWTGCSPGCTSRAPRTCGCWPRSPGPDLLSRCYQAAIDAGYLWHEFGDVHLLLP